MKEKYLERKENRFGPKMQAKYSKNKLNFLVQYAEFESLFFKNICSNRSYKRIISHGSYKTYYEIIDGIFLDTDKIEDIIYVVFLNDEFIEIYDDYDPKNNKKKSEEISNIGMEYFLKAFEDKKSKGEYYFNTLSDHEYATKKSIYNFEKKECYLKETKKLLNKTKLITEENKKLLLSDEMFPFYYYVGETSVVIENTYNYFISRPHNIILKEDRGGELEYRPLYANDFYNVNNKRLYPIIEKDKILYYINVDDLKILFKEFLNKDIIHIFNLSFGYMLYKAPALFKTITYGGYYHKEYNKSPYWQDFCAYVFTEINKGEINCVKLPNKNK